MGEREDVEEAEGHTIRGTSGGRRRKGRGDREADLTASQPALQQAFVLQGRVD